MTDDIKDEFYKQADDLARSGGYDAYRQGLARTLQDHAAKMQEVSDAVEKWFAGSTAGVPTLFAPFVIAKPAPPPDPDEELAREVAHNAWALPTSNYDYEAARQTSLATIKALRDKGLLK